MKFRVCMCCGEPIPAQGNNHSRNPNVCASCSSIVDGEVELPEDKLPELSAADPAEPAKAGEARRAA